LHERWRVAQRSLGGPKPHFLTSSVIIALTNNRNPERNDDKNKRTNHPSTLVEKVPWSLVEL
jgi:hypothetical protein